jgi:plastocyanin
LRLRCIPVLVVFAAVSAAQPTVFLSRNINPAGAGTLTANPASADGFYTLGANVDLTATPAPGYIFTSYSGDLSGFLNPQTLGMVAPRSVTANFTSIPAGFTDVNPSDFFYEAVNLMKARGVTAGCSMLPLQYCPNANVTRAQMAIFIVRAALGGDGFSYSNTPYFFDVPPNAFGFAWIQKMYELGITAGCGGGNYCPNDAVTRGQMAVFVTRARLGAAADSTFTYPALPSFLDVPINHAFFKWIQRMKVDAITAGCGIGIYCPDDLVTRGQMAVFIMRGAFNSLLPSGQPVLSSVTPASGRAGQTFTVSIGGGSTHFTAGSPVVSAGAGISVSNVTASHDTQLTAQFTVAGNAAPGPRTVLVTTGTEEAALPNGFRVSENFPVSIVNFQFVPDPTNVTTSSVVTWTNNDFFTHRLGADGGSFDTMDVTQGQVATVAFPTAGTFTYHCSIHPSMTGTIVVR